MTMRCPECGVEFDRFYVNAPAVVETVQMVGAEVTFAEIAKDLKHDASGAAYLPTFRLDDRLETLDTCTDFYALEIGNDDQATFYCPECNAELDKAAVWSEIGWVRA